MGDIINYTYNVANTGNVTLTAAPVLNDNKIGAITCPAFPGGTLAPSEFIVCTAPYTVTQVDLDNGGVTNIADVTSADIPPANPPSTATLTVPATQTPTLNFVKTANPAANVSAGNTVNFSYTVQNTGNVTLTAVTMADQQTSAAGTNPLTIAGDSLTTDVGTIGDSTDAGANGIWDTLAPGDTVSFSASYLVTQADVDSGNALSNTASVTTTSPPGTTPPTGNQTVSVPVTPAAPALDVVKTVNSIGAVAGDLVVFDIAALNSGNVTLTGLNITDGLSRIGGGALTPDSVTFTGPGLITDPLNVGATVNWQVTYTLQQADINAGGVQNTATVGGVSPGGGTVSDVSDDGDDGDGNTTDDPTVASITANPSFGVTKSASALTIHFPTIYEVTFTIDVANTGNITQTGIQVTDDLTAFLGSATLLNITYPPVITQTGFTGTPGINAGYDGQGTNALLSGSADLPPATSGQVLLTVTFQDTGGQLGGTNTASVTSNQLTTPTTATSTTLNSDADGDGIPDYLEGCTAADDRDGDGICDQQDYDPTGYFYCEDTGTILSGGAISITGPGGTQTGVGSSANITIVQDGSTGYFQFFVTAAGSYTMNLTYPPSGNASTARTTLGGLDVYNPVAQ